MDKTQQEILKIQERPNSKKFETSIIMRISIPQKLYNRALSYMRQKGLKENFLLMASLDEFLTKNNY